MILIFELDIEISAVYWLYKNQWNRTSNKNVINKVHELFVHPSYIAERTSLDSELMGVDLAGFANFHVTVATFDRWS